MNKLYDTRPTSGTSGFGSGSGTSGFGSGSDIQQEPSNEGPHEGARLSREGPQDVSGDEISEVNKQLTPYFDLNHSGNVTAVLGKTALMNCRVKNIGNKTVSNKLLGGYI